jgi:hypothetical protein
MSTAYKSFFTENDGNDHLAKRTNFMRNLLSAYDTIRGKIPPVGAAYWDIVVITAGAEEQRAWYETQLEEKRLRGELPLVDFRVFSDPGGVRTGDGGATLHVVAELGRDSPICK